MDCLEVDKREELLIMLSDWLYNNSIMVTGWCLVVKWLDVLT